jgi:hypothetical protein
VSRDDWPYSAKPTSKKPDDSPSEPESPSNENDAASLPAVKPPLLDDLLLNMVAWMVICGLFLGTLLGALVAARFGMGVGLGSICAVINLVAYTYVVNRLLDTGSAFWVTALVLKTFALFVVFGWLLKREYVDALPFVIGYAALPLGAVLGVLLPLRRQVPPPTG